MFLYPDRQFQIPERWDIMITNVVVNFLSNSLSYGLFELYNLHVYAA